MAMTSSLITTFLQPVVISSKVVSHSNHARMVAWTLGNAQQ
jgi:hypothetical protein